MTCEERRDELLDLLYGEAEPEPRRQLEAHLAACPGCRSELESLRRLRGELAVWSLPEAPAEPRRSAAPAGRRELWRLAAAAVLVLACGGALGLSGVSLAYERGPLRLQLGRPQPASLERQLAEQEARHRAALAALRAELTAVAAPAALEQPDQDVPLERVADLIRASESRQRQRLEASWAEFNAEAETQRRYDLARISAGLSYLDHKAGAHAARTSELMGVLIDASAQVKR